MAKRPKVCIDRVLPADQMRFQSTCAAKLAPMPGKGDFYLSHARLEYNRIVRRTWFLVWRCFQSGFDP